LSGTAAGLSFGYSRYAFLAMLYGMSMTRFITGIIEGVPGTMVPDMIVKR